MEQVKIRYRTSKYSRQRGSSQLRLLRMMASLSQDELAFRTGIDASRISRLERGYGRLRDTEKILFARAFGVPADIFSSKDAK